MVSRPAAHTAVLSLSVTAGVGGPVADRDTGRSARLAGRFNTVTDVGCGGRAGTHGRQGADAGELDGTADWDWSERLPVTAVQRRSRPWVDSRATGRQLIASTAVRRSEAASRNRLADVIASPRRRRR